MFIGAVVGVLLDYRRNAKEVLGGSIVEKERLVGDGKLLKEFDI